MPTVPEAQHGTFKETSSGLQSFLLLPLSAGPQLLSLPPLQAATLLQAKGVSPQPPALQPSAWETPSQQLAGAAGARQVCAAVEGSSEDPVTTAAPNYQFLFTDGINGDSHGTLFLDLKLSKEER